MEAYNNQIYDTVPTETMMQIISIIYIAEIKQLDHKIKEQYITGNSNSTDNKTPNGK